jgi:hypothetical protein
MEMQESGSIFCKDHIRKTRTPGRSGSDENKPADYFFIAAGPQVSFERAFSRST